MATLQVGYNIFKAPTQAGTDDGTPGVLQAETAVTGKHKVRVQRTSDSNYWNNSTPGWQAGAPAEADELDFVGSYSPSGRGIENSVRRLEMRLPQAVLDGITSDAAILTVYGTGLTPAGGKAITVDFASL